MKIELLNRVLKPKNDRKNNEKHVNRHMNLF
jgi:hypothetical protein